MSEGEQSVVYQSEPPSNIGKWIFVVLGIAYVAASAFFIYDHQRKLDNVTQEETTNQKQLGDLTKRLQTAEADSETLAHQLGMTKKELATRTAELQRQQKLTAARFTAQAEQEKQDINAVAGEVGSVKTDVGGRGSMGEHRPRIFLEVVGRKHLIVRRHPGFEEPPGFPERGPAAEDLAEEARLYPAV